MTTVIHIVLDAAEQLNFSLLLDGLSRVFGGPEYVTLMKTKIQNLRQQTNKQTLVTVETTSVSQLRTTCITV